LILYFVSNKIQINIEIIPIIIVLKIKRGGDSASGFSINSIIRSPIAIIHKIAQEKPFFEEANVFKLERFC